MRGLLALLGLMLLAACAAPKAELDADRMGRLFVDAVQRGDWPAIDRGIAPQLMASPDHAAGIEKVRQAFPVDPPWSIRLLASRQAGGKGASGPEHAKLQYLYQFAERRAVVDLTLVPVGWRKVIPATAQTPRKESALLSAKPEPPALGSGGYEVVRVYQALTMSYTEVTKPDEASQAFWAPGRTAGQWLFLGLAVATPAFMLWTVVRVFRMPVLEGRLFWALALRDHGLPALQPAPHGVRSREGAITPLALDGQPDSPHRGPGGQRANGHGTPQDVTFT